MAGQWAREFQPYRRVIETLDQRMHAHRPFLQAKYEAIRPEINAASQRGVVYEACASCGFSASQVDDEEPLVLCRCQVCGAQREYLRVECPSCDEKVVVDDPSLEEDCPHCGTAIEVSALVERYGPVEDPKEDSMLAFCSECERTDMDTVIPFGDDEYLCLNCATRHGSAANCGWCNARVTGLDSVDSSVFGCILCDGSCGSDHS